MNLIKFDYNNKHYLLSSKGNVMEIIGTPNDGGLMPRDDVPKDVIDKILIENNLQPTKQMK